MAECENRPEVVCPPKHFFLRPVYFLNCLQWECHIFTLCYKCQQRDKVLRAARLLFFSGRRERVKRCASHYHLLPSRPIIVVAGLDKYHKDQLPHPTCTSAVKPGSFQLQLLNQTMVLPEMFPRPTISHEPT